MIISLSRKKLYLMVAFILVLILTLSSSFFWQFFYPIPYRELIKKYSAENNLDPFLVTAMMRTESKFNPLVESRRGARGLMQIMPDTGAWIAEQMHLEDYNVDALYDEETNIKMGTWYIANLMQQFEDEVLVIAAYNAGRGNVREWLRRNEWSGDRETVEDVPFKETRDYIKKVLNYKKTYMQIYDNQF